MRIILLLCLGICFGCGDVASTHSSTVNTQDNSVDNSQHGISKCTAGNSVVCREQTPDDQGGVATFLQTVECVNVAGEPVILDGPNPVDGNVDEACPKGEAIIVPAE